MWLEDGRAGESREEMERWGEEEPGTSPPSMAEDAAHTSKDGLGKDSSPTLSQMPSDTLEDG